GEHLGHLREGTELPWPLPKKHFNPKVAAQTYEEHLQAWTLMDELGYDGIGFNEHHTSPYGLMNSPNIMVAAAAQRTKNLKLLVYGNLLPIHDPLRLAEELAMVDCLSEGRLISGFARGIPREHNVYQVPMKDSRARFEESWEIIKRAWTEEVFSYEGKFWTYKDVAIWPRPYQQPYPPVWLPVTGSKETIQFAGREDIPITPGLVPHLGVRHDIVNYYAQCLSENGHQITPDHLILPANAFVADSRADAVKQAGPYSLYFSQTLFSHGNITEASLQTQQGYINSDAYDYVKPENRVFMSGNRENYRNMTIEKIEQNEDLAWGTANEVRDKLIETAEAVGANTLLISFNRGAMPGDMFMEQLRRFGADVLPALQAHEVKKVPVS
ncbi:MAG: LLM class flavin-dependent oxidoreductase, partial [Chloroflexi bacterium]|nr:LLM class flavin-dependent oxidoreductase [Chloroflexota bacterium]